MKTRFRDLGDLLAQANPLVFCCMVLSVVGMNLLANKSIDTGVGWLALDCGILLSGACFLAMDVLTHTCGPRVASAASLTAMVLNLAMAAVFWLASVVPGTWGESFVDVGGDAINAALDGTFGGTWFVLAGSSVAFAASALVNNALNWAIGQRVAGEGFGTFALRSYVSTFVAQFVDNITFALLVSRTFFGWTTLQCVTCALTGAVLELLFEVFFSPVGYRISQAILAEGAGAPAAKEA